MTRPQKHCTWYREPWAWGVLAGPILVIPAALVTYYLAAHQSDTLVSDDYYQEGKNIHLQLNRDAQAHAQSISANVLFNPESNMIRVVLNGHFNQNEKLKISIIHPTLSPLDQSVYLQLIGDFNQVYEAKIRPLPKMSNWYVRIESDSAHWRIQGKWLVHKGPNLLLTPKYVTMPVHHYNNTH